ncbi:MAG: hypothetical protein IKF11_07590 [Methanobrevibacter sp.]|nr:hypothetical protein [Methanobrevibacter sp.]
MIKSYNLTYRAISSGNSQISINNINIIDWNENTITSNIINNSSIEINEPIINPDLKNGFITENGNIYYYINGEKQKGIVYINENIYHFGENSGGLKIGWSQTLNGNKYYSNSEGKIQKGWLKLGNSKYYASNDGIIQRGIITIDESKYHFGENSGELKIGWSQTLNGNKYYSDSEGIIQTGNQNIDGVDYVFDENGILQSGYQTINGKTYYYYRDGSLAKGVVKIQGERNYFSFTTGELLNRNVKLIADVSYANGYINWDQLWASGQIDGVIIRIGYGASRVDNPVIDSYFAYNIAAVKRLGIPYSIYLFGYAQTTEAAAREAQFTANWLNQYGATNLSLPIFYDAEISYWNNLNYTADVYSNTISTYANTLNSLGFGSVGVYGSYSWFAYEGGRLNSDTIKKYPLWVAQYYNRCSYFGAYGWQYTSDGSLPGINGRVDLSIFF